MLTPHEVTVFGKQNTVRSVLVTSFVLNVSYVSCPRALTASSFEGTRSLSIGSRVWGIQGANSFAVPI